LPRDLSQSVVVITGASSGIGRAAARACGRHGRGDVVRALLDALKGAARGLRHG
jgi:NAD(P)-dependent dehydrogenase (short-subunit alcohol dehydrogenase family)